MAQGRRPLPVGIRLPETFELIVVGEPSADEFLVVEQTTRHERIPVREPFRAQGAENPAVRFENSPVPVAERARLRTCGLP